MIGFKKEDFNIEWKTSEKGVKNEGKVVKNEGKVMKNEGKRGRDVDRKNGLD